MDDAIKLNSKLLKDTKRFIELYRRESMKEHIDKLIDSGLRVTFQGRPLLLYAKIISETARDQASKNPQLTAAGLPAKYELLYKTSRSDRVQIKDLFEKVDFDERKFHFIESALNQNYQIFPKEVLDTLAEAEKLPESPEKAERMEKVLAKSDQTTIKPIQAEEVTSQPVKTETIEATPEEINKELLNYKEKTKEEVKYTEKTHPVFSTPEELKKLEQLSQVKPKPPEKIIVPQAQKLVLPDQANLPIPVSKTKPEEEKAKPVEQPAVIPEKSKGSEIKEEGGVPIWTSPKTGKKYPLKIAGGAEAAVIPMPKPQTFAPVLPTIRLPDIKINLGQKIQALKAVKAPEPVRKLALDSFSFARRLVIRNSATMLSSTVGGLVAATVVGPTAIPAGLVVGGLFPKVIKSGVLQKSGSAVLAKGAGNLAVKGALGLSNPIGWAWLALTTPGIKTAVKYAVIAFLAIFLLPMFINLNKSSSLFPPYSTAYSAPDSGSRPGGIPIDQSCKFTRGDQPTKDVSFKSTLLLNYFQEASQISGVPAVLLAAVARVESPGSSNLTDSEITSYAANRCAISPTGALGIMQMQPPGTTGYFASGVEFAAKQYLSTTPDKLTSADFCDPQKNILISAGFIIKKTHALLSTSGDQWNSSWLSDKSVIDTIARGYYGCLTYGGPDPKKCDGPYNYGDDLWKSIQSCQTLPPSQPAPPANYIASCPVPGGKITTPSYSANKSTGHCGESYGYSCNCGTSGRRAKAIDVPTNGQDVFLPTIENKQVKWSLLLKGYPVDAGEGGGVGHTFEAKVGEDWWYLDILHMQQTGLVFGQEYASGTVIGKSAAAHAHMTIGKNNNRKPISPGSSANSTDCDPGWVASDFLCR